MAESSSSQAERHQNGQRAATEVRQSVSGWGLKLNVRQFSGDADITDLGGPTLRTTRTTVAEK